MSSVKRSEVDEMEELVNSIENDIPESTDLLAVAIRKEQTKELAEIRKNLTELKKCEDEGFVRTSLRDLMVDGREMLSIIMQEFNMSRSPRLAEVAGVLIKSLNETLKTLIDIKFKTRELDIVENRTNNDNPTETNVIMVGDFSSVMQKLTDVKESDLIETEANIIES
jgi:hypothetical protein